MGKAMFGVAALALAGVFGMARADEEKLALDKVPAPVMQAVKDRFPRGEAVAASKETENGQTLFEVEIKRQGVTIDVTATADGKIVGIETTIAAEDFPRAVAEAIKAKHPAGKIKKSEEVVKVRDGKEVLEYFEAEVEADGKTYELKFQGDGKPVGEEKK